MANHENIPQRPFGQARIEPAQTEHFSEIIQLASVIWHAYYPGIISTEQIDYMLERGYNMETLLRELEKGIHWDQLVVDDTLVGFASYGPARKSGEMKIHKLYLHPDWQRKGLGSLFLNHMSITSRHQCYQTLILNVNKHNTAAINAYKKNGFHIRESIEVDIGHGYIMDDYVMEKSI